MSDWALRVLVVDFARELLAVADVETSRALGDAITRPANVDAAMAELKGALA